MNSESKYFWSGWIEREEFRMGRHSDLRRSDLANVLAEIIMQFLLTVQGPDSNISRRRSQSVHVPGLRREARDWPCFPGGARSDPGCHRRAIGRKSLDTPGLKVCHENGAVRRRDDRGGALIGRHGGIRCGPAFHQASAAIEFQDARLRRFRHVQIPLLVRADSHRAGKMALGSAPPTLQERSVGEKDDDAAAFGVGGVNRAATVYGDSRGMPHAPIFEREKRSAIRFEFVDEAFRRIDKEDVPESIASESDGCVQFTWTVAFFAPYAEELKRRGWLRLRRRGRGIPARN